AEWLPNTAKKFITALRKEKQHGRMVENGFKAVAWTNAAKVLREDLSINYTVLQLKNQWTKLRLRGQYKNLVELRQQSGFGWDGDRFMVTATDNVWEPLLEKHSKFRWFRTHPFPLFDDLAFLCENTFATGEHAFAV
ncbi:Myb/SANT-like DNA-binding domain-containing protein, partial [Irpex lacteus]